MTELTNQAEMDLLGGLHQVNPLEVPTDEVVLSFANEQQAIDHCIQHGLRTTGCTHVALSKESGMNKSQFSLLWSGQRGIPMGRLVQFIRATGSAALLKFYALQLGLVMKTTHEWGAAVRNQRKQAERITELEHQRNELAARLSAYEDVADYG